MPYYVVKKDLDKNIVYVSKNLNHEAIWVREIKLKDLILRGSAPEKVQVRLRHRAPLIDATYKNGALLFKDEVKRPASGQSAVIYSGEVCLGGGIIE